MAAKGVSVLITGANRGLGLEMVKQMLGGPIPVGKLFACCRDPDGPRAEALQALAKEHPNTILVIPMDVNDLCSIKESVQQVSSVVGKEGLNLLINNAGIMVKRSLLDCTPEDVQNVFNTNVIGPLNVNKEFLPLLRDAAKASEISGMSCSKAASVSMSSFLGSLELVGQTYSDFPYLPYYISKAALNMMTLCAMEELRKDEILFSVMHPGWVRTDMGGENGDIDVTESVEGMLRVLASLTEKQNGAFLNYKGNPREGCAKKSQ